MSETRAKIVATLGPASFPPAVLEAMVRTGVDVFRLNGAHTPPPRVAALVRRVRAVGRRVGRDLGVMLDLPGVKVRCGAVLGGTLIVKPGERLELGPARGPRPGLIPVPRAVFGALVPGAEVLLSDGSVVLRVLERGPTTARARVEAGGTIRDRVGVHVRGALHPGAVLTPLDLELARVGAAAGVDALAISFVRGPADVRRLRRILERVPVRMPLLVGKLERREAVENLDATLDACDGVMVARGDLGLEYGPEEVPGLQKRILEAASRHGRFAITATQMLESMTTAAPPHPRGGLGRRERGLRRHRRGDVVGRDGRGRPPGARRGDDEPHPGRGRGRPALPLRGRPADPRPRRRRAPAGSARRPRGGPPRHGRPGGGGRRVHARRAVGPAAREGAAPCPDLRLRARTRRGARAPAVVGRPAAATCLRAARPTPSCGPSSRGSRASSGSAPATAWSS